MDAGYFPRGAQEAAALEVPSERLATRVRCPLNVSRASGVSVVSATMRSAIWLAACCLLPAAG
jgi:hypothetical protein